jgi:hypothetical protein
MRITQFEHSAACFLLSCTVDFASSCTQSPATITIVIYVVETVEQKYKGIEMRQKTSILKSVKGKKM